MKSCYALLTRYAFVAVLSFYVFRAQAQSACSFLKDLQVTNITATSATFSCTVPGGIADGITCSVTVTCNGKSTAYGSGPVLLTGLLPNQSYTVDAVRTCTLAGSCGPNYHSTITFTTASALAAQPATQPGSPTLFPNPTEAGRTTFTLTTPLPQACSVFLLDARGRVVWQSVMLAGTGSVELNLTGVAAGVYAVRCGGLAYRLIVE